MLAKWNVHHSNSWWWLMSNFAHDMCVCVCVWKCHVKFTLVHITSHSEHICQFYTKWLFYHHIGYTVVLTCSIIQGILVYFTTKFGTQNGKSKERKERNYVSVNESGMWIDTKQHTVFNQTTKKKGIAYVVVLQFLYMTQYNTTEHLTVVICWCVKFGGVLVNWILRSVCYIYLHFFMFIWFCFCATSIWFSHFYDKYVCFVFIFVAMKMRQKRI